MCLILCVSYEKTDRNNHVEHLILEIK